jgi:hypothetical protein
MLLPIPHSPYFLIKVLKHEEDARREKSGLLYVPSSEVLMQHNTQCGEIMNIGIYARKYFPEAKRGHTLLCHHFVQGNNKHEAREDHLVYETDTDNYYVVTAYEYNGKGVECYGVWDGEQIIPNKDFVFLVNEKVEAGAGLQESLDSALEKSNTGLFLFKEWKESRESKESRQSELKLQVESLSKSGVNKPHIQQAIRDKEIEMENINRDINKQKYLSYTVAFANPQLSEWFGRPVVPGDNLAILNIAAQTTIKFMGIEYIVCKTNHIAGLVENKIAA